MPVTQFAEWLQQNKKTGLDFNGNDVYQWLTSSSVSQMTYQFESGHGDGLDYLREPVKQTQRALGFALVKLFDNRPEVLNHCESLGGLLSAGQAILESVVDQKWSQREALDDVAPLPTVFYRKMSSGEFAAAMKDGPKFRFKAAFDYTNTPNYRYWVSSSLGKVQKFENENSTDSGGKIIKFTFSHGLVATFEHSLAPHQKRGVQHNPNLVAFHREGFATKGNVCEDEQMWQLITDMKNFNLGFTSAQCTQLQSLLKSHQVLN